MIRRFVFLQHTLYISTQNLWKATKLTILDWDASTSCHVLNFDDVVLEIFYGLHASLNCETVTYDLLTFPGSISTWDQRCFNVVDQRWNNVDLTLKMKQNLTSDFHRCITLMQHQCTTLLKKFPQRRIKLSQRCFKVDMTLSQPCFNVVSTLVKAISNPIPLAINMEVWICK